MSMNLRPANIPNAVAAPAQTPTNHIDWAAELDAIVAGQAVNGSVSDIARLIGRYGAYELLSLMSIEDNALCLNIPQSMFFGSSEPGPKFFMAQLCFPRMENGQYYAQFQISWLPPSADGHLEAFKAVGANEARDGKWINLGSGKFAVAELINNGYVADSAIDTVMHWVTTNAGASSNLKVLPSADFWAQLYATTHTKDDVSKGIRAGALANIGMQQWDTELGILAQQSSLRMRRQVERKVSAADFMALSTQAPVAAPQAPVPAQLSSAELDEAFS